MSEKNEKPTPKSEKKLPTAPEKKISTPDAPKVELTKEPVVKTANESVVETLLASKEENRDVSLGKDFLPGETKSEITEKSLVEKDLDLLKKPLPTKEVNDIFVDEDLDLNQDIKKEYQQETSDENEEELLTKNDLKFAKVLDSNERVHFEKIIRSQKDAIRSLRSQVFELQQEAKKNKE